MKKYNEVIQPTFKKLTYLCMQTLTNFPFIEEDFDALTNYELLCKVVEYLNKVIANENKLNEDVQTLANAFNQLKNYVDDYFDNLDVQEEIDNKLDEMAESGELTDIIAQYLGLAGMITFDNVSDMKLAENLVNGSKCRTLGFYSINDNGASLYKIRTITNDDIVDEKTIISLYDNTLIAELVTSDVINFEQVGAKGDGTTNDTLSIQKAFDFNKRIESAKNKTYLINDDITITNDIDLDLGNSTIKSSAGNDIIIDTGTTNVNIKNGILDNVDIQDSLESETNYNIENLSIKDTEVYGLKLDNVNKIYVDKCSFNNIGKGTININHQGCGIRVNYVKYANVSNSTFENCHGTGACVIRNANEMYIKNNYFNNNDYRAIVPADDQANTGLVTKGLIESNIIKNCGVNASHNTGVGCNGIYANCYQDISNLVVRGNNITNVCENGIEGRFGIVEYNYVDGTGVDQVNHPTPSASGINMYGGIYRYNVVKNSYLAGLYVSGVSHSESTVLENKKIYGNNIGKPTSTNVAIYVNGTEYHNIDIYDNVIEGTITLPVAAKFYKCAIGNNFSLKGMPFTSTNAATYLLDKGAITFNGFDISDTTITNITTASCSYAIGTDDVTFTSSGTGGAFSFISNCNKNTISVVKFITNDATSEIKLTVQGVKEDDSVVTLASNRLLQVQNNITGLFMANDNTYKQFKFLVTVGNTSATLKLKNIQVKEITY